MKAPLDMNSQRILNLPTPVNPTDAVRLQDISGGGTMPQWIVIAAGAPTGNPSFVGQVYINSTNFNLYQATSATAWTLVGNLVGPSGPGTGDMLASQNLSTLTNFATARANLGLAIGINVQAFSAALQTLSGTAQTPYGLSLLSVANAAALQAQLALGGAALLNVGTTAGTVAAGNDSRFSNLTPNTQNANYTFQISDRAGLVLANSATPFTWTIPPSLFSTGDIINVRASVGAGAITLARGSGVTLTLAGSTTNKNYTLAAAGFGSLICEGANTFFISGAGIS